MSSHGPCPRIGSIAAARRAETSRVNIAGINHGNVDRVADAIAAVLK